MSDSRLQARGNADWQIGHEEYGNFDIIFGPFLRTLSSIFKLYFHPSRGV